MAISIARLLKIRKSRRRIGKREPGAVVIMEKKRKSRKPKKDGIAFIPKSDMAYLMDARHLCELLSTALAAHYRNSLRYGVTLNGRGTLPEVKTDKGRRMGFKTGTMARKWQLGPIKGDASRATRAVAPYQEGKYAKVVPALIKHGVNLSPTDGKAHAVIRTVTQYFPHLAGPRGTSLPKRPGTQAVTLNRARHAAK